MDDAADDDIEAEAFDDLDDDDDFAGEDFDEAFADDLEDEDLEEEFDEDDFDDVEDDEPPVRRPRVPGFIAAGLLGIEEALYGVRKNEIVMVADADGMPEPDFDITLTPDPRDSYVVLRRHRRESRG